MTSENVSVLLLASQMHVLPVYINIYTHMDTCSTRLNTSKLAGSVASGVRTPNGQVERGRYPSHDVAGFWK